MPLTVTMKGIDRLAAALSSLPLQVESGVKVIGETNYIKAMRWDLGAIDIKPGPKTLWGLNVYGEQVVLTVTAPTGFIRVQKQAYRTILKEELRRVNFRGTPVGQWGDLLTGAMAQAAQRCSELIAAAAPIDTGDLRSSIVPAMPGDAVFGLNDVANMLGTVLKS